MTNLESSSTPTGDESGAENAQTWLTERRFFLAIALILLFVTTTRFNGDLPAFFWSLIVLAGVMYFE